MIGFNGQSVLGVLFGSSAVVIASTAPAWMRLGGRILHALIGNAVGVCNGANDEVEINAAINSLPAAGSVYGGEVKLSTGGFNTAGPILIKTGVHIVSSSGQWQTGSTITASHAGAIIEPASVGIYGVLLENLTLYGCAATTRMIDFSGVSNSVVRRVECDWAVNAVGLYIASVLLPNRMAIFNTFYDLFTSNVLTGVNIISHNAGVGSAGANRFYGGHVTALGSAVKIEGYTRSCIFSGMTISGDTISVEANGTPGNNVHQNLFEMIDMENSTAGAVGFQFGANTDHNTVLAAAIALPGAGSTPWSDAGTNNIMIGGNNASPDLSILRDLQVDSLNILERTNFTAYQNLLMSGRHLIIPVSAFIGEALVGTGASDTAYNRVQVRTGAVLGGQAIRYLDNSGATYPGWLNYGQNYDYRINWDEILLIKFSFSTYNSDAAIQRYFQLKAVNTHGDLAAKGIGLYFNNLTLNGQSYGIALGNSNLGATSAAIAYDAEILLTPATSIKYYINGVLAGTQATANNIPTGTTTGFYWVVSVDNGAAAVNGYLHISPIEVWQAR